MLKQMIVGVALGAFATQAYGQTAGQVVDRVICAADGSQSYALYIPVRGDQQPLPIVYFFDSHGVGSLPLRKYKALADTYGFILVGSNNSKNGNDWATTETIWDRLFSDTHRRLKIDEQRIYTAGFSGGRKGSQLCRYPAFPGQRSYCEWRRPAGWRLRRRFLF